MSNLAVFDYNSNFVRIIEQNGEPWFVAKDLCQILEIRNVSDALSRLDEDEKDIVSTDTLGGKQNTAIVSESGMYALVLSSRKPEAKPFRKWVTAEVLPSIRKTGQYTYTPQPTHRSPQQPAPQQPQLPQVTSIALAGLDAALSGVINPSLLAGVKLNAIAALHPETNIALEEGRKLLSHATITQGQLLTPTELGERLGISARKVNQLLIEKGLQIKNPDQHKGASAYLPTDKGLEFAEFTLATGRKGDNTSYQHIKWYLSVARVLNPQISVVA